MNGFREPTFGHVASRLENVAPGKHETGAGRTVPVTVSPCDPQSRTAGRGRGVPAGPDHASRPDQRGKHVTSSSPRRRSPPSLRREGFSTAIEGGPHHSYLDRPRSPGFSDEWPDGGGGGPGGTEEGLHPLPVSGHVPSADLVRTRGRSSTSTEDGSGRREERGGGEGEGKGGGGDGYGALVLRGVSLSRGRTPVGSTVGPDRRLLRTLPGDPPPSSRVLRILREQGRLLDSTARSRPVAYGIRPDTPVPVGSRSLGFSTTDPGLGVNLKPSGYSTNYSSG